MFVRKKSSFRKKGEDDPFHQCCYIWKGLLYNFQFWAPQLFINVWRCSTVLEQTWAFGLTVRLVSKLSIYVCKIQPLSSLTAWYFCWLEIRLSLQNLTRRYQLWLDTSTSVLWYKLNIYSHSKLLFIVSLLIFIHHKIGIIFFIVMLT